MKKIVTILSIMILTFTTKIYAINITDAGDTVTQTGSYDSTRLVAGNTVTNKAEIDGLSLIAGNDLTLEGSAPYGFFAGNNITINEKIEKDLFAAGNNITLGSNAEIGRDVSLAGNIIRVKTNINRDLRVSGTSVDLSGVTIKGDAYLAAERIIMDSETVIEGKLTYPEDSKIENLDKAQVSRVEAIKTTTVKIEYTMADRVRNLTIGTITSFLTLTILFLVVPGVKEKLDKSEITPESILKKTGIGLVTLVSVPMISIIAMITVVLIPVSLITLTLYIISLYISSLLVYYIVGNEICKKLNKENKYLSILIGIITVKLIKFIPVIGGLVSLLCLLYGMGLIVYLATKKKSNS